MSILLREIQCGVAVFIGNFYIRTVRKQYFNNLGLTLRGGEHQCGKALFGVAYIEIRPAVYQELHRVSVRPRGGVHQCGASHAVKDICFCPAIHEQSHGLGVAVKCCHHQGRPAIGIHGIGRCPLVKTGPHQFDLPFKSRASQCLLGRVGVLERLCPNRISEGQKGQG